MEGEKGRQRWRREGGLVRGQKREWRRGRMGDQEEERREGEEEGGEGREEREERKGERSGEVGKEGEGGGRRGEKEGAVVTLLREEIGRDRVQPLDGVLVLTQIVIYYSCSSSLYAWGIYVAYVFDVHAHAEAKRGQWVSQTLPLHCILLRQGPLLTLELGSW